MRVLFVDAGNYCRSPAAEVVARTLAERAGMSGWAFGSAGLKDKHAGDHADPRSVEACSQRGYDLSAFRCREITAADFLGSDLILAMDRDNLAQLERMRPRAHAGELDLFLRFGGGARGLEVPDPYYGGEEGFEEVLDLIEEAADGLLAHIRSTRF